MVGGPGSEGTPGSYRGYVVQWDNVRDLGDNVAFRCPSVSNVQVKVEKG